VVLEKIEMTPRHFLEIMGLAQLATFGAGKLRSAAGLDGKAQLMRAFARVQHLFDNLPGMLKAQSQCDDIVSVHALFSCSVWI